MKRFLLIFFSIFIFSFVKSQLILDLESGAAAFGYNDVRISGSEGTQFSLSTDFKNNVSPFFRARVQYNIGKRHSVLALYAPLTIKSNGIFQKDIYFQDVIFKAGYITNSTWKFNSYRLTYQYNIIVKEKILFAVGLTAKIRDAKIALSNSDMSAEKTNLGIVPLIRFYADWKVAKKMHLILDGDALVAKQGRAEDILLAIGYDPIERLSIKLGYRLLEGGADNDEVYNFSSVHYAAIGASWTFK